MPTKYVTKRINRRTLEPEYIVTIEGEPRRIRGNCMLEIPGLAGDGFVAYEPLELLREALGLSLAAEQYGAEFFSQAAHPNAVITYPGSLKKAQDEKFRTDLREGYIGLGKKHRLMILEEGLKYEKIASNPAEGQMTESRKFQATEMARFFNVPPHKIMDLDRATWNNIEEMNTSFLTDTMLPWYRNIEQAVMQGMIFSSDRKAGVYAEFDMNMFMRGKIADRYAAYQKSVMYGWLSPNEVREKENLSHFPGGDDHYIPTNLAKIEENQTKGGRK
jgi:HK97 family phage portal protein